MKIVSYFTGDKFRKYDFRTPGEAYINNGLSWLIKVLRKGCFRTYDPGMDIWGGENLELSFRVCALDQF
jgi:hypothetical protein